MSRTRHARLRQVLGTEAQKARSFWELHPSKYLVPRPVGELREVAEQGGIFVVELDHHWAACTALFPVADLPLVELSDTRVVEGLAGFGLQPKVLTPLRLATSMLGELDAAILMVIDRTNETSMKNCRSSGFIDWTDAPQEVLDALELARADAAYALLRMPPHVAWRQVARFLEQLSTDDTFTLQREDESLVVAIELPVIQAPDLRGALEKAVAAARNARRR